MSLVVIHAAPRVDSRRVATRYRRFCSKPNCPCGRSKVKRDNRRRRRAMLKSKKRL